MALRDISFLNFLKRLTAAKDTYRQAESDSLNSDKLSGILRQQDTIYLGR